MYSTDIVLNTSTIKEVNLTERLIFAGLGLGLWSGLGL